MRLRHSNPADILSDWLDNHVDLHHPIQKLVKVGLDYAGLPVELPQVERSIRRFYDLAKRNPTSEARCSGCQVTDTSPLDHRRRNGARDQG